MEKKVIIDFEEDSSTIVLTVSVTSIYLNPSFRLLLSRLKALKQDRTAKIIVTPETLGPTYKQLLKILGDMNCVIEELSKFSEEVSEIKEKEKEFEIFAKKALAIWNREAVPEELRYFENIITNKIDRTLSELQFLSALHLTVSQNACNFSVPGAGKTAIVYSAYACLNSLDQKDAKHIDRILVIGPLASFISWQKEFEMCFGRKANSVRIISGMAVSDRKNILSGVDPKYRNVELVHASFQTVTNYESDFTEFLSHPTLKTMLIVDEAHNIKREDGIWASTCIRLASKAHSRVVLTGTPAPNGYEDLYNLFKFLYPEKNLIGFPRPNLIAMSESKMSSEAMRNRIKPFFTRITKKDLGLPPILEKTILLPMSPLEEKIYSYVENTIIPDLSRDEEDEIKPFQRANLIRLRQCASNPEMLLKPLEDEFGNAGYQDSGINIKDTEIYESITSYDFIRDSSKYQFLKELCQERIGKGEKILVWSYFISTLYALERFLEKDLGANVWRISGSTPSEGSNQSLDEFQLTREKIIETFIEDPTPQILIANPQALGESVSLHYSCHLAVYFDRDFNCGRFIQSKDRIHRYGLKDVTTEYFYLAYQNSIDEDISSRLDIKEKRMNDIIERDDIPLFREMDDGGGETDDIVAVLKSYAARRLQ